MSARIFFKDESEIMPSHTGDDVVNHFINVRTPVKFLCHFAHNFLINLSCVDLIKSKCKEKNEHF